MTTGFYLILSTHRNSKFIKHDKICDICIHIQIMSSGNADVGFFSSSNIYTTNKINNSKITRLSNGECQHRALNV